jgi:hypothetical protein
MYRKFNDMVQNASEYIIANTDLAPLYKSGVLEETLQASQIEVLDFIGKHKDTIAAVVDADIHKSDDGEAKTGATAKPNAGANAVRVLAGIYTKIFANYISLYKIQNIVSELSKYKDKTVGHIDMAINDNIINNMVDEILSKI